MVIGVSKTPSASARTFGVSSAYSDSTLPVPSTDALVSSYLVQSFAMTALNSAPTRVRVSAMAHGTAPSAHSVAEDWPVVRRVVLCILRPFRNILR